MLTSSFESFSSVETTTIQNGQYLSSFTQTIRQTRSACSSIVDIGGSVDLLQSGAASRVVPTEKKLSLKKNAIKRNLRKQNKAERKPPNLSLSSTNASFFIMETDPDDMSPMSPVYQKRKQNIQCQSTAFSLFNTSANPLPLSSGGSFYAEEEERRKKDREVCKGMTEVLPGKLYVGSYDNLGCHDGFRRSNIKKVVTAMSTRPEDLATLMPSWIRGDDHMFIEIKDRGDQEISQYFEQVNNLIDSNDGATFIHCHSGISRSVTLCLAYLLKSKTCQTLGDATKYMNKRRPISNPNLGFMGQLSVYAKGLDNWDSGIELDSLEM